MTPEELVNAACPKIGSLGSKFYFDKATRDRGKELGLDGFRFYVVGRGGVLGDVEPGVIRSAFGYFTTEVITKMWTTSVEAISPRQAGREFMACCGEFGRTHLSDLDGLDAFVDALETVNAAADATAYALYAGFSAEPAQQGAAARAMQLVAGLREYRGCAHLAAIRAAGLPDRIAHAIRRPSDVGTFGYEESVLDEVTDEHRAVLRAVDATTDQMVLEAYGAVDSTGAAALMSGLEQMESKLG